MLNYSDHSRYICSQSAIILLHILSDLEFQVRYILLTAHIAAEVLVDGQWVYLDPYNNISPYVTDGIPVNLEQLSSINSKDSTSLLDKYYIGFSARFKPIIFSTHDNIKHDYSRKTMLRYRYSLKEVLADMVKWCFPFLLLISPTIPRVIRFLKG